MTVEDYLGRERRMAADFNRDVAPLGIEDVEGVVVHIGHRLLGFDVMVGADVPHRRAWARPTRIRNRPCVISVFARYSSANSCLRSPAGQWTTGMPLAFAYRGMRRLKRPARRIRCVLSNVSSDP